MARVRAPDRPLDELEERIGQPIVDKDRLERALTHSSLRGGAGESNYERLEFLGDRVLGLVVAERLFEMFPRAQEGDLSLRFNALVSADACAVTADAIGLADFIRHGGDLKRVKGVHTKNVRADVVEALIAAIYLGEGMEAARRFILRFWKERLAESVTARRDPKTELQEWAHAKAATTPRYVMVDRDGPDHDPVFTVRATIEGVEPAEGKGRSKRLAEQAAATHILRREGIWKEAE
ncbi:ribonuclease III [Mangrovibrevibacter kandeliae]|uniref:ribonuclease III n=1 Tax=Mangrovibrevibacter kandeliae TaxID=2968473 RepID=UPI0021180D31|nr:MULTISPECIES: ribonuclease III [unclassified Aurantimonas]MCQ8781135.1 ribonuclease III [Aurantimonas sp. CSK15Z-1]MCW4113915.1 ribonuclease III [Aurantimonas sp. MSK8Z-1]